MIIQALCEYYNRKANDPDGNIAPQGLEWKEIPFIIVLDQNGIFQYLEDTQEGTGKAKRAKSFLVPKGQSRTGKNSNQITNILWDHYGYVLGIIGKTKCTIFAKRNVPKNIFQYCSEYKKMVCKDTIFCLTHAKKPFK